MNMSNYCFIIYLNWLMMNTRVIVAFVDLNASSSNEQKLTSIYTQVLSTFPRHVHMYHFENNTKHELESILQIETHESSVLMNYDMKVMFRRPRQHACINFILLRNTTKFNELFYTPTNVNAMDVIFIVLYSPYSKFDYWDSVRFILVFSHVNNTLHVIRYYRNQTMMLRVELTSANTDLLTADKHDKLFHKLFVMNIGFKKCPPFAEVNGTDGIEMQVLQVVMAKLNLNYRLLDYSNDTVGQTLDDLSNGKLHLVVGCLSNTIRRNQLVAFTPSFFYEHYTVIYSSNDFEENTLLLIFRPFNLVVWILLSLIMCIIGLISFIMHKALNDGPQGGILLYLGIPLQSILEQPFLMKFRQFSIRLVICTWLIASLIVSNYYKSKLSASVIHPSYKEPDSLTDMLENNFDYFLNNIDFVFLGDIMTTSFNRTFQKVVARKTAFNDICACILNITKTRFGIIGEETVLRYSTWYTCKEQLTKRQISSLRITRRHIMNNGHAWALKKSSSFIERIEHALEDLKSYGIILKWYKSFKITRLLTKSNSPDNHQRRDTQFLSAPFYMLGLGILLSIFIFLFEVIYWKCRRSMFQI